MKTLFLMRHAKSSWDDPELADHDRPLNERGTRAAAFMGQFAAENGLLPQKLLVSTAERANNTALLLLDAAGSTIEPEVKAEVYEASPQRLAEVVHDIDNTLHTAMIVGHNPGMEGLIRYLTGSIEPMPTAALAVLELNIDAWAKAGRSCGRVHAVYRPKQLMRDE